MRKTPFLLGGFSAVCIFLFVCYLHMQKEESKLNTSARFSAGDDDDPQARLRHEWTMLRDPATNEIPSGIRQREMEFAKDLPKKEETDNPDATWASRGPWNVGGRTRALGIHINDANLINAGGVSGGMWRSTDGGATWTKRTAVGSLHSVSCLAQDIRAGQTATWYYGTGERLGNSAGGNFSAVYTGNGIFKSVDNGVSWTQLASTMGGDPQSFDRSWDYVWNIAVHPTTGNIYAAAYNAIYRSIDGGTNWTLVRGGAETGPYSEMTDVAIASDGTIYATGSPGSSTLQGVWKSTDGTNWTNITPGDMSVVRRIVIGIAPSNSNAVYFLAETPGLGLNNHSIWKYNATANTYQNRSANMPAYGTPVGDFDSQASYDLVITVKPDNENVVIIGGTNLYRSTDGFASTGNTVWIGGYATTNDISQYPNHHPDNHSLVFAPNNASILFSGHDGGISKTTNVLASPMVWQQLSVGYLTTQFYTVAMDHATNGSNTIIGGLQDNGCWKTTSASGTATWSSIGSGDGAFTAVSNGGGSDYVSSQNGVTYRNFGAQFTRVDPTGGTGYLFINPFVLDPNNSNIMYFAGGNYAWRNSDLTAIPAGSNNTTSVNWTRLDNSVITGQTQVSALAVSKVNPANRLYIARSPQGYLTRVDNANTGDPAGVDIGTAIPTGFISSVAVDPTDGSKVFVVFSNYNLASLWYSADAGATWTDVEGNLAGANGPSCRSVTIVPSGGTTTYYLGTSTGLYSTTSLSGTTTVWVQEGATSIGNVVVTFLDSRASDGVVMVGTHANGVYSNVGGGGLQTTAAPTVNSPIAVGATTVSGTSTEANGTTVQVYVNGVVTGTATTVTGGAWTTTGLAALVAGNLVKAKATATGKLESVFSNEVTVGATQITMYPGDANIDAAVDVRDILPIGRFFGVTGPARPNGSLTWAGQTTTAWTVPEATHADCDGNGTVDANDVQGILTNYGRTRSSPDAPIVNRVDVCNALLHEIDKERDLSPAMKEIRNAIVSYMKRELGITFDFALNQNWPNPFNPSTTIRFTVPMEVAEARITIYDIAGREVWSHALDDVQPGNHEVVWNGETAALTNAASGMYIYRFTAGNYSATKRMLLLK